MQRLTLATLLGLLIFGIAAAQPSESKSCPSLSVRGPSEVPSPGDVVPFTLTIEKTTDPVDVTIIWSVSTGEMISGQGTKTIYVRLPRIGSSSITAAAQVSGFAAGCTNTADETLSGTFAPQPVKIGVIRSFEADALEAELAGFMRELEQFPNNQGYIIIDHKKGATDAERAAKEKIIAEAIANGVEHYDRSRITIVRWDEGSGIAEFWRIPPGAENPLCSECVESAKPTRDCPRIAITGPAGVTMPGDPMTFSAELIGEVPNGLRYHWKIKGGEIIDGQGTLQIQGKYSSSVSHEDVLASITVSGLPNVCPATASEKLHMTVDPGPELLGSIRGAKYLIDRDLIQRTGKALRQQPYAQLYVIVYWGHSLKNFAVIKSHLLKQLSGTKIDQTRFTIVSSPIKNREAAFWLIPLGVANPQP